MTPASKAALFATIAVLINWHYSVAGTTQFDHGKSSYSMNISGAGLTSLFCFVAIIFLGRALYRRIRKYLASGIRIPSEAKLMEWPPCLILLLLFVRVSTSVTSSEGATSTTTGWGYGSDQALPAFALGVAFISIFQMNANLARLAGKESL